MRHLPRTTRSIAALAAAGLLLAACGTDEPEEATDTTDAEASSDDTDHDDGGAGELAVAIDSSGDPYADVKAAAAHVNEAARTLSGGVAAAAGYDGDVDSTSAEIRAGLTQLLQEHVYLAGYAVDAAYSFGPDSGEFELAAAALDENSVELADTVGSVAGDENREAFLELWRQHIGFFVDYAVAESQGDEEAKQQALDDLQGYTGDAGAFFEQITGGELPADAVAGSLEEHISTLTAAIDGFAAGDAGAFDSLEGAADHVVGAAEVLSGGIAAAIDADGDTDGDTDSEASQLRSGLTASLQEHVYLAGIAVMVVELEDA